MADLNEVLKDPDFWGPETTDDTRKAVLHSIPKFKEMYAPAQTDIFLKNQRKVYEDSRKREEGAQVQGAQKASEGIQKHQTMWEQAVAPVTNAVGLGMEALTEPFVPLARMMNGEGFKEAFSGPSTVGHGGKAAATRNQAAAGVVPQSPWQAGAMGAQFIPGVGQAGALARVGAAAGGAGLLQGLLGEKGLVEGGTGGEALEEGAWGAAKGGATQAGGELFGKLLGLGRRGTATIGLTESTPSKDVRRVVDTVKGLSPELNPGKGAARAGEFFAGSKGAETAAGNALSAKMRKLEGDLIKTQGDPYIKSPELLAAYRDTVKSMGKKAVYDEQLKSLRPTQGGFLPEQAVKVMALIRDNMKLNPTASGHWNQESLNILAKQIEDALPAAARGMFSGARADYARASAITELMEGAMKTGRRGWGIDAPALQSKIATDKDLPARMGADALDKLVSAATRGAGKGFSDVKGSGNFSYPYHLTPVATGFAAIRNFLTRNHMVGKHPQALKEGTKAGLGLATTAASSVAERARKEQ